MNPGKVSNSILKRSVFKLLKSKNEKVACKPGIGLDCAVIDMEGKRVLTSTACGIDPVTRVANNIAACGGVPVAAQCAVLMPTDFNEKELKAIVRELDEECAEYGMQVSGGHTQVSGSVTSPVITVTGIGYCEDGIDISGAGASPGQDIIITGHIGIGGIRKIIELKKDEILRMYSKDVLDKAFGSSKDTSVLKEAGIAAAYGVAAMHDISEGGVMAALWNMAEASKVGLEIDLNRIPVMQEVIEICEMFEINPYELESSGSLLIAAQDGYDLIRRFEEAGVPAVIVGRTTNGNDRIIRNDDEIRYLDTPKRDEIYKFI